MTFREIFSAEQLFLRLAKENIDATSVNSSSDFIDDKTMEKCAVGIVFCAFAMEALVNKFLKKIDEDIFWENERRSIKDKLKILKKEIKLPVDFGRKPWKDVQELNDARNWMAHHKYPEPGLIGSEGYVSDCTQNTGAPCNIVPDFAPHKTLTLNSLVKYYNAVLQCAKEIASMLNAKDEFEFLWNERYEPFLYG